MQCYDEKMNSRNHILWFLRTHMNLLSLPVAISVTTAALCVWEKGFLILSEPFRVINVWNRVKGL